MIFSLLTVGAHQMQMRGAAPGPGGFREGLHYMGTQPRLQDLFVCVVLMTFFAISIIQILPSMASEVLHGDV